MKRDRSMKKCRLLKALPRHVWRRVFDMAYDPNSEGLHHRGCVSMNKKCPKREGYVEGDIANAINFVWSNYVARRTCSLSVCMCITRAECILGLFLNATDDLSKLRLLKQKLRHLARHTHMCSLYEMWSSLLKGLSGGSMVTAVQLAAVHGYVGVFEFLQRNGNLSLSKADFSVLRWAITHGCKNVVHYLYSTLGLTIQPCFCRRCTTPPHKRYFLSPLGLSVLLI